MRIDYVIHKAEFKPADKLNLYVPIGSTVRHIGEQAAGRIAIWYERPVTAMGEMEVLFYCFGTGHPIDVSNLRATYFQTVIMRNGLVWHFYISYPESNEVK